MRLICTLAACLIVHADTIQVAPNILVSRDSALPKVELMIAANPQNSKNLVATGIAATPFTETCMVYTSFDGGYNWKAVVPPGLPETGSGDPQVAFGPDGAGYFSALGLFPDETGRPRFAAALFRSRDGGLNWEKIAILGAGTGPDHDMIVVDKQGRLFLSVVYSQNGQSNIGVFRLDPGETTVHGPLRAAEGAGSMVFTWNPLVLSRGTLFAPYQVFHGPVDRSPAREIFAARSSNGGVAFAPAAKIGTQTLDPRNSVNPYGNVAFAADSGTARFRDRIYMLWNEASATGGYSLKLAFSTDNGSTWSQPRDLDPGRGPRGNAFRPAIAVNSEGVVGVSWLDTRDSATGRTYREYFTASLDGGVTFITPAAVSSVESSLDASANFALHPTIDSPRTARDGSLEFSFMTTLGRFPDGGDYMGLTADSAGVFHPLWADTRTGAFQAWTAAVRVNRNAGAAGQPNDGGDLNKRLRPVFDPGSYDAGTGIEAIPIRLQNISATPVCGPLIVTVRDPENTPHDTPRVLNADNRKPWDGALFDYTSALRDLPCLAPGEISDAVVWQVQPLLQEKTFITIRISITHHAGEK